MDRARMIHLTHTIILQNPEHYVMRWMIIISILLVFTLLTGGCMPGTSNPVPSASPPNINSGTSSMTTGGSAIAIAVNAQEITTPYPEARELFIKGLTLSTQYTQYNDSLVYFDRALDIDPNFTDAWYAKGVALHNLKRYSEAVQSYDRALLLEPENAAVWSLKGRTFTDMGRNDEAADCYRKATEIDPRYV
jgi:tetratricopeptide (TPR) repeat protein